MNRSQAHKKGVGAGCGVQKLVQGKFILGRDGADVKARKCETNYTHSLAECLRACAGLQRGAQLQSSQGLL